MVAGNYRVLTEEESTRAWYAIYAVRNNFPLKPPSPVGLETQAATMGVGLMLGILFERDVITEEQMYAACILISSQETVAAVHDLVWGA